MMTMTTTTDAPAITMTQRLDAIARPYGCTVESAEPWGRGYMLWAGAGAWGFGDEDELKKILDLNPQVGLGRPRGGASCRHCGGPVADGGSDCGECR